MHVASMQRCALAVAESTGTASKQRRAPAAAEAPKRWCPVAGDPIATRSRNETPCFPAFVNECDCILQVEVRSGCTINMVSESTAEELGLEIVIDEFGYEDYIDSAQVFPISQSGIIGLSCFTMIHNDCQLWFDGFVVADDVLKNSHMNVVAGAPFMEQNDVCIRPSKHIITFGDYGVVFSYGNPSVIRHDVPLGMGGTVAPEGVSECAHEPESETVNDVDKPAQLEGERETTSDDAIDGKPAPECGVCDPIPIMHTVKSRVDENDHDDCAHNRSNVCTHSETEWCVLRTDHRDNVSSDVCATEFALEIEGEETSCSCIESAEFPPETEIVDGQSDPKKRVGFDVNPHSATLTEHSVSFPGVVCNSSCHPGGYLHCFDPPVLELSPVCGTTTVDCQYNSNTNPYEGDVTICVPPISSARIVNVCPVDVLAERHQGLKPVVVAYGPSASSASVSSGSDEGAHPFSNGATCTSYMSPRHSIPPVNHHHNHVAGPAGETRDHPHDTDDQTAPHRMPHDPDSDVQMLPTAFKERVPLEPPVQSPAEDTVTSPTDQPPAEDTSEPSHSAIHLSVHAPSAKSIAQVTGQMLGYNIDDAYQQTLLADIDTFGLHLQLDDAGPAYRDTSPTYLDTGPAYRDTSPAYRDTRPAWNPSPWTCGPRPPSVCTAGGPFPRPHERAPCAVSRIKPPERTSDIQASPNVVGDLASVDVNHPPVPWTKYPSAPPDFTGPAAPPHPPMSPLIPG